jgi:hypothetical protein
MDLKSYVGLVLADCDGYGTAQAAALQERRDAGERLVKLEQIDDHGRHRLELYDDATGDLIFRGLYEDGMALLDADPTLADVDAIVTAAHEAYEESGESTRYPAGVPRGLFHAVMEWVEVNLDEARAFVSGLPAPHECRPPVLTKAHDPRLNGRPIDLPGVVWRCGCGQLLVVGGGAGPGEARRWEVAGEPLHRKYRSLAAGEMA